MISKDTAYIDDEGRIVRETITRPLSGLHDFLNTYIVNIYPDTTCWVNDFANAENERYMLQYFSNPAYIISPDEDFEKFYGRKADKKRKLYNGMIKCQLFMYYR
jgi:hypothetical protein